MKYYFVKAAQSVMGIAGLRLTENRTDAVIDSEFGEIYEKCKSYSMTSKERMFALYKAVEYVVKADIPGDFVECGVWKGGSSMVIAYTLLKLGVKNRKIYLYDTFEGMSEPTEADKDISNGKSISDVWKKLNKDGHNEWCYASLEEVKNAMKLTSYPKAMIKYVKGKVEETIPKEIPSQIALLRLDTDWYESTKHELEHLYPLLSKNGVLLIDDYGCWEGAKKAVDEYFADKAPILLNRVDYTGRIGVKNL